MTEVIVTLSYRETYDDGDCETCGGGGYSSGYYIKVGDQEILDFMPDEIVPCFDVAHFTLVEALNGILKYVKENDLTISEFFVTGE